MKSQLFILAVCCVFVRPMAAEEHTTDAIFNEAFEGMFDSKSWNEFQIDASVMDNPPPPVPLDGGLTALLAAGAAVGYRRFRTKRLASKSNI